MYKLIDGKVHSARIRSELKHSICEYNEEYGRQIGLAVVLIGDNSASQVYVKNKIRACEEVGIKSYVYTLPVECTQDEAEELVSSVCSDDNINGVIVQLPLPPNLDEAKILKLIPIAKDVDGFLPENMGKLCQRDKAAMYPCTPFGIMKMLEGEGIDIKGKQAVVLGRSIIVGKPMAMLLLNADATVTVCHSKTKNLKDICLGADILVAAIGVAKFVKADMVKDGAVVIDVGMDRDENNKLCGDVDFESVAQKCSYITPVPGGVGPMTVTMLMYNTYMAALRSHDEL